MEIRYLKSVDTLKSTTPLSGLLNEILCILGAQEAAKLSKVKV